MRGHFGCFFRPAIGYKFGNFKDPHRLFFSDEMVDGVELVEVLKRGFFGPFSSVELADGVASVEIFRENIWSAFLVLFSSFCGHAGGELRGVSLFDFQTIKPAIRLPKSITDDVFSIIDFRFSQRLAGRPGMRVAANTPTGTCFLYLANVKNLYYIDNVL
ncbi:MAG: hypothetical protein WC285_04090 [Candidatus Gracilibacteria bacterium]